jgi:DNA integrity scanning protein DisA with diadenylate cyclase activity
MVVPVYIHCSKTTRLALTDFENFITICDTRVHAFDIFGRIVLDLLRSRLLEIGMDQTQINLRTAEKYANQQQETALSIFPVQEASSPMIWINKIK